MNSTSANFFINFDCFVKNKVSLDFDSQRLMEKLNINNKMMKKIENIKNNNRYGLEANIYKRKKYAAGMNDYFSKINKRNKDICCLNIENNKTMESMSRNEKNN